MTRAKRGEAFMRRGRSRRRRAPSAGLFISAVTDAELRLWLALLPDGKRREQLADALVDVQQDILETFVDRGQL